MTDHAHRNETAKNTETSRDSAAGPEPTGAQTPGALGAPTPSGRTQHATDPDDDPSPAG